MGHLLFTWRSSLESFATKLIIKDEFYTSLVPPFVAKPSRARYMTVNLN